MGYTTQFKGTLSITPELTASQIAHLNKFLGEDIRSHKEWERNQWADKLFYMIDLELTPDLTGLKWTGIEKSYEMVAQVNYIVTQMRRVCPAFALSGRLVAQGEDTDDRWELVIGSDGLAMKRDTPLAGKKIVCPPCERCIKVHH